MVRVRSFRGLNQQQLADRVGVRRSAIRDIETGKRGIQLAEAAEIAAVLDVPLDLMCGEQPLTLHVTIAPAPASATRTR